MTGRYAEVDTEAIRAALPIDSVINEHTQLRKRGRQMWGLCPFHTEKTPSFAVDPEKGLWFCHGACNVGGDLFEFVQRVEGVTFAEAKVRLADRAGIPCESKRLSRAQRAEYAIRRRHAEELAEDAAYSIEQFSRWTQRRIAEIWRLENAFARWARANIDNPDHLNWAWDVIVYRLTEYAERLTGVLRFIESASPDDLIRIHTAVRRRCPLPETEAARRREEKGRWEAALQAILEASAA